MLLADTLRCQRSKTASHGVVFDNVALEANVELKEFVVCAVNEFAQWAGESERMRMYRTENIWRKHVSGVGAPSLMSPRVPAGAGDVYTKIEMRRAWLSVPVSLSSDMDAHLAFQLRALVEVDYVLFSWLTQSVICMLSAHCVRPGAYEVRYRVCGSQVDAMVASESNVEVIFLAEFASGAVGLVCPANASWAALQTLTAVREPVVQVGGAHAVSHTPISMPTSQSGSTTTATAIDDAPDEFVTFRSPLSETYKSLELVRRARDTANREHGLQRKWAG